MSKDLWTRVDSFFAQSLMPEDPVLQAALQASQDAGLPAINVAPNQGKLLHLMARMAGARRILEIGTLAAYSTIWLARALPAGGSLVTLEADAAHAAVARANIAMAGLQDVVDLREGKALDILPSLHGPFDFVFIDADKTNNPAYLQWALTLSRPGTTIVFDNVVRNGQVLDPDAEEKVVAVRRLTEILAAEPRVSATAVQTVGEKGWDGFILAVVN
ncbi:MAG: O-methyltransferase [Magnetospirillum gryphiswaldense]|nr:O-methyltransferase [Magnetospirillum gryphiswaldense]